MTERWKWGVIALAVGLVAVLFLSPQAPHLRAEPRDGSVRPPRTILLIRHAEKPPDIAVSELLSPRGEERAHELHRLFEPSGGRPAVLPRPDFLFAASVSKHSRRPLETLAPLAEVLHLRVHDEFSKDDYEGLAKELLKMPTYSGKTVLVCWHHSTLPLLARALGVRSPPDEWHGSAFDRVWRIDYDEAGKATLNRKPQNLLPGDRKK
ncbi:MAG: histidine phosphatase family protein [Gemmataceae bacterium]